MYDFHGCYCSLAMRKSMFDHARDECVEMEGSILERQSQILTSIEELLGQDVHTSSSLNLEGLKEKMNFAYFQGLESIRKNQLDDLVSPMIFISNLQNHTPDWESHLDALDVIELQQDGLPSVMMEELNSVISRFVENATKERDRGRNLLEDSLLDD